ncbi:hypothetical protein H5410_046733 [Solanum commersonii]|uniref:Uncharacterized protein n=1 Tax=Solanum commersonii TaxID=4109 RepID=A0A9J5XD32_SOLCO|nr:hypothetical protein H5410_046733 [Solanum commersonii]
MLEGLCFPTRFIQCILECVQTVHYSIIVNSEPTEPFDASNEVISKQIESRSIIPSAPNFVLLTYVL